MTKQNMIQAIQNQEAQAYLRYMMAQQWYGAEDALTDRLRGKWCGIKWCAIYHVMETLGIQQDFRHPDNIAAAELRASQSETRAA
jgi:hypothetical protein